MPDRILKDLPEIEKAVYLEGILKAFGWSRRKFFYRLKALLSDGVVFYRYEGKPPCRRLCAFPSEIRKWIKLKSSKGEIL